MFVRAASNKKLRKPPPPTTPTTPSLASSDGALLTRWTCLAPEKQFAVAADSPLTLVDLADLVTEHRWNKLSEAARTALMGFLYVDDCEPVPPLAPAAPVAPAPVAPAPVAVAVVNDDIAVCAQSPSTSSPTTGVPLSLVPGESEKSPHVDVAAGGNFSSFALAGAARTTRARARRMESAAETETDLHAGNDSDDNGGCNLGAVDVLVSDSEAADGWGNCISNTRRTQKGAAEETQRQQEGIGALSRTRRYGSPKPNNNTNSRVTCRDQPPDVYLDVKVATDTVDTTSQVTATSSIEKAEAEAELNQATRSSSSPPPFCTKWADAQLAPRKQKGPDGTRGTEADKVAFAEVGGAMAAVVGARMKRWTFKTDSFRHSLEIYADYMKNGWLVSMMKDELDELEPAKSDEKVQGRSTSVPEPAPHGGQTVIQHPFFKRAFDLELNANEENDEEWKDANFEQFWGEQSQRANPSKAGASATVSLDDLFGCGLLRVSDTLHYFKGFESQKILIDVRLTIMKFAKGGILTCEYESPKRKKVCRDFTGLNNIESVLYDERACGMRKPNGNAWKCITRIRGSDSIRAFALRKVFLDMFPR